MAEMIREYIYSVNKAMRVQSIANSGSFVQHYITSHHQFDFASVTILKCENNLFRRQ